jgi:molecular chaperone GrpE (heat shock protein)
MGYALIPQQSATKFRYALFQLRSSAIPLRTCGIHAWRVCGLIIRHQFSPSSNTRLGHLCGALDEHLRTIETGLQVKISHSHEKFKIDGLKANANRALEVLQAMLPVLDDFDRAMAQIAKSEDEILLKGVELIHEKLKNTLVSKGLEQVDIRPGDSFNADFAEAITQIPAPSDDLKGKIVDVVEKGYKLGDKIIRFPKVVIGQ